MICTNADAKMTLFGYRKVFLDKLETLQTLLEKIKRLGSWQDKSF